MCFTACLQLVKVNTVHVFLGTSLLVQESESQKDQYLFEICPVEHSVQIAIRLTFPVFPVFFQASLQLVPARSLNIVLYLIGSDLPASKYLQSPKMPRTTKPAKAFTSTAEKIQEESRTHEESSSSDQEQDPEVFIQPSKAQLLPNMFMPYIEGPKMDWTMNDGLYHRFLKWHMKCENILKCELAMLPEKRQCKKVICMEW